MLRQEKSLSPKKKKKKKKNKQTNKHKHKHKQTKQNKTRQEESCLHTILIIKICQIYIWTGNSKRIKVMPLMLKLVSPKYERK